jgi:hypothetical protein
VTRSLPSWHQAPKTALALREHKTKIRIVPNFCLAACRLPVIRGSCRDGERQKESTLRGVEQGTGRKKADAPAAATDTAAARRASAAATDTAAARRASGWKGRLDQNRDHRAKAPSKRRRYGRRLKRHDRAKHASFVPRLRIMAPRITVHIFDRHERRIAPHAPGPGHSRMARSIADFPAR